MYKQFACRADTIENLLVGVSDPDSALNVVTSGAEWPICIFRRPI